MEHEVVHGRVREAEKELVREGVFELVMPEQVRQQAIGIVPADGAENHVDLRITKCLQKIPGTFFRMCFTIFQPLQRMGHELDIQAVFLQPLETDLYLKMYARFPDNSAGKADDGYISDHSLLQTCFYLFTSFPSIIVIEEQLVKHLFINGLPKK